MLYSDWCLSAVSTLIECNNLDGIFAEKYGLICVKIVICYILRALIIFYIYITNIISNEIIIKYIFQEVMATQLTTIVLLCSCNNNIILKMAAISAETCY